MGKKKRNGSREIAPSKKWRDLWRRITTILAGVAVLVATVYVYQFTSQRHYLFKHGSLTKAIVSNIEEHRRSSSRDLYVTIERIEYDAGSDRGRYGYINIGDTVEVYHLPGYKYPALKDASGFMVQLIFEYAMFVLGGALMLIGFFYPAEKD